jgi:hypothetical protein
MTLLEVYNQTGRKSDKEHFHHYISNFYCEKLTPRKNDNIKILEIGIFAGDSLKLWEDFFPNAEIYGLDIVDYSKYIHSDRVKKYMMNAYDESALSFFKNKGIKFDIIIDDGPHSLETQDYACKNYKQFLNDGGIFVVEDIQLCNLETLQRNNPEFTTLNLLHVAQCYMDNILMYIEK